MHAKIRQVVVIIVQSVNKVEFANQVLFWSKQENIIDKGKAGQPLV